MWYSLVSFTLKFYLTHLKICVFRVLPDAVVPQALMEPQAERYEDFGDFCNTGMLYMKMFFFSH